MLIHVQKEEAALLPLIEDTMDNETEMRLCGSTPRRANDAAGASPPVANASRLANQNSPQSMALPHALDWRLDCDAEARPKMAVAQRNPAAERRKTIRSVVMRSTGRMRQILTAAFGLMLGPFNSIPCFRIWRVAGGQPSFRRAAILGSEHNTWVL